VVVVQTQVPQRQTGHAVETRADRSRGEHQRGECDVALEKVPIKERIKLIHNDKTFNTAV
jgi:hypothetical protein